MVVKGCAALLALFVLGSCAGPARPALLPETTLVQASAPTRPLSLHALLGRSRFTVVEFFSADCACQRAHDARLVALARRYTTSGVQLVAVDPEVGTSAADVAAEARQRGYPFPLFVDPHAQLATALGAQFATYVVLVDRDGRVYYRGGIDSDHTRLTPDATPFLANAIDDVLLGRPPRRPEAKALGCALRTR